MNFTNSSMTLTGTVLVITLGTPSAAAPNGPTNATNDENWSMHWVPSAAATDLAGNAMSTTMVREVGSSASGTVDKEF